MDKMKGLAKGGWHPAGDKQIRKETWKSDLKGIATRKNKDPYEEQRNHVSVPLSSLRDPDSFGPPPKHSGATAVARTGSGFSGTSNSATSVGGPSGGWGGQAVEPGYAERKRQREEEEMRRMEEQRYEESTFHGAYQKDTTGLRTDNLPKPPLRRDVAAESPGSPGARASPTLPPRQNARPPPAAPPRQNAAPPPVLPPRQNEYPDENTPAPPPPYQEALRQQPLAQVQSQAKNVAQLSQGASQRLSQAGVSVPGFGIGSNDAQRSPVPGAQASQVSELQQRFARMNTGRGSAVESAAGSAIISGATAAAQKKPPPPPPKKTSLSAAIQAQQSSGSSGQDDNAAPPPIPMSSKPRSG